MLHQFDRLHPADRVIAERVLRTAQRECAEGSCAIAPILEACVLESLEPLLGSEIKTHIPALAMRQVRCCIEAGTCDCGPCS